MTLILTRLCTVRWLPLLVALAALVATRDASAQPAEETTETDSAVTVRAVAERAIVRPGDQIAIAVVLDHPPKYHSWPGAHVQLPSAAGEVERTAITVPTVPAWVAKIDGIQWPAPHTESVVNPNDGGTMTVPVYSGRAVAFVRALVSPTAAPGEGTLDIVIHYQTCDANSCFQPETITRSVTLTIAAPGSVLPPAAPNEPELFKSFDVAGWGKTAPPAATQTQPIVFQVFGYSFTVDPTGVVGLSLLMLTAALGGLLLNFTPCVLPVIPIKILGLSQSAGNPRRCLLLGIVMSVGIVAFWLGIGAAMTFIAGFKSISTLFQNPWFPLAVAAFMAAMSLGMIGFFAVRLPNWVYAINPSHETMHGSLGFGVMTAVLSTPCTAPFMGAAAAWAAFQPAALTLSTFAAIGVGMALPYLLLAANPRWVSRVPRTGPASELVKQVMGLLMLAVAAFFAGPPIAGWLQTPPDPPTRVYWWIVFALIAAAFGWLAYRTVRITKSTGKRLAFGGLSVAMIVVAGLVCSAWASHGPIKWVYYTPQRFQEAVSKGNVVVIDFTAEWCLNCRTLEGTVLHRPEIVRLLNSGDRVVAMKVDITGDNPDGKAKLKELQWVGIPLLAIYGPGLAEPVKFDWYTPDMVLKAVEQARGGATAQATPAPAR